MGRIRFGWAQLALGSFLLASAGWLGGAAWVLAWPAVSVIVVGVGYLGAGPSVFGKRADGTLRLLPGVVLLPYHVVAYLRMHWDAVRHAEAPWHRVAEGLYLGRRTPSAQLPDDVAIVVDLTAELPRIARLPAHVRYHVIPTLDATAPAYEPLERLVSELASLEEPIFVHCAAGHGRSAAFAAALLVARARAVGARDAEALLQAARPLVRLHREQRELVDRFAQAWRARGDAGAVAESRP